MYNISADIFSTCVRVFDTTTLINSPPPLFFFFFLFFSPSSSPLLLFARAPIACGSQTLAGKSRDKTSGICLNTQTYQAPALVCSFFFFSSFFPPLLSLPIVFGPPASDSFQCSFVSVLAAPEGGSDAGSSTTRIRLGQDLHGPVLSESSKPSSKLVCLFFLSFFLSFFLDPCLPSDPLLVCLSEYFTLVSFTFFPSKSASAKNK